jgi:hypothetical protein
MSYAMGAHGVSGIQIRPAQTPTAWTAKQLIASAQSGGLAGSPTEVSVAVGPVRRAPRADIAVAGHRARARTP